MITDRRLGVITVDVEDYFQAEALRAHCPRNRWDSLEDRTEANTDRLLDLLEGKGIRGTFFVLGWSADRHPELVRRIADRGHEVASHGYDHELIYRQEPQVFRADVDRARKLLQDLSGQPVLGYRAPSYTVVSRTRWALDILAETGHVYDSSIFPIRRQKYGIPDAPRAPHRVGKGDALIEFPLPAVRVGGVNLPATGGAYTRLFPMMFQRWAVRRLLGEGIPVAVNVHPWELDPGQPRMELTPLRRLIHYGNLSRTEARLSSLLDLAQFAPMIEILGELGFTEGLSPEFDV